MNRSSLLDRRAVIAGTVATGCAIAAVARPAFAQNATPDASASPESSTSTDSGADGSAPGQQFIDRLTNRLTSLETDLAAVSSTIDTTTIDGIVSQARDLLAQTQTHIDASDNELAIRYGLATESAIASARMLIEAQLAYAGLPSDQNWASRALANAYDIIQQVSTASSSTTSDTGSNVDVSFYTGTAQSLYGNAYNLYQSDAWAQAGRTGRAAIRLVSIAPILTAEKGAGLHVTMPRGRGRGDDVPGMGGSGSGSMDGGDGGPMFGIGGFRDRNNDENGGGMVDITEQDDEDTATPVDVPAPDFGG